jgi:hypothetical protein
MQQQSSGLCLSSIIDNKSKYSNVAVEAHDTARQREAVYPALPCQSLARIDISWTINERISTFALQVSLIASFRTFARHSSAWEPYASVVADEIWSTRVFIKHQGRLSLHSTLLRCLLGPRMGDSEPLPYISSALDDEVRVECYVGSFNACPFQVLNIIARLGANRDGSAVCRSLNGGFTYPNVESWFAANACPETC